MCFIELSFLIDPKNYSFTSGMFSDMLIQAKVIQIFKSGDSTESSNYRPI